MTRLILPDAARNEPLPTVPTVFFHHPCTDGFTAAWAFWTKFPDWEYVATTHSDLDSLADELASVDAHWMGEDVYFLDICPKKDALVKLLDLVHPSGRTVYVLDHHKSALDWLQDYEHPGLGKFLDSSRSGAGLAWDYIYAGEVPRPGIVDLVEDRDLWRFALEGSRELHGWLFLQDKSFEAWSAARDALESPATQEIVWAQAYAIADKVRADVRALAERAGWSVIGGWEIPTANAPGFLASELGHELCKGVPFAATWSEVNGRRHYSLRSETGAGIDVAEIAKMYGGGGHKHAAGFSITPPALTDLSEYVIGPDGVPYNETRRTE